MKEDRIYVAHIRDAIERIEAFTSDGREHFLIDPMIQDALSAISK